ncbi:MAG: PDZ domain-containing protein [bacterium]|nr:PDZ domain-containing protein [bacterium]
MNSKAFGWMFGVAVAGLAPTAPLFAQQHERTTEERTAEERIGEERAAPPKASQQSVSEWIDELGAESYKRRVRAERALRDLGKAALPALQKAAEATADPEVQWRSKRLVRQIERGGSSGKAGDVEAREPGRRQAPAAPGRRRGLPEARDQFEDIFRRMERDFGVDIPRRRFFADDFFKDLDQQFRDLRDMQGRLQGMSQGMNMQVGPDGVRVEVMEQNEDGELEKKVYEAKDMESFQEQYPDVLKGNGLSFDLSPFGLRSFQGSPWGALPFDEQNLPESWRPFLQDRGNRRRALMPFVQIDPDAFDSQDDPFAPFQRPSRRNVPNEAAAPPADGERLGVRIRDQIAPAVREFLGLEDGVGLMIEMVQDGTLGAALKLERGDIVTRIGGEAIGSAEDVRRALRAIPEGKDVKVEWIRRGHRCEDSVKKRFTAPEAVVPKAKAKTSRRPVLERSGLKKASKDKRIVR